MTCSKLYLGAMICLFVENWRDDILMEKVQGLSFAVHDAYVDIIKHRIRYWLILSYLDLGNELFNCPHVFIDFCLNGVEQRFSLTANFKRTIKIKRCFVFDRPQLISLIKQFRALQFPQPILLLAMFFLNQSWYASIYFLEVLNHIFVCFLLCQFDVLIQFCKLLFDVLNESFFFFAYLLDDAFLESCTVNLIFNLSSSAAELTELVILFSDHCLDFFYRFDVVITMVSK